jgi:RNase P/RNase MRP subunit POP5
VELYSLLTWIALAMSTLSIAITILAIPRVYREIEQIISELGTAVLTRRKYRRVKRYILVKFLCLDSNDYRDLSNYLKKSIYSLLGPVLKHRCNIELISYRADTGRAIIRVRGEAICVPYTLLALSIQHINHLLGSCIAIPIRTSGLLSRLRRRYLR